MKELSVGNQSILDAIEKEYKIDKTGKRKIALTG